MSAPYRILLVEDSENDAILLEHLLQADGMSFSLSRVESREAFEKALTCEEWDIVLSDCMLPTFSAEELPAAVVTARETAAAGGRAERPARAASA